MRAKHAQRRQEVSQRVRGIWNQVCEEFDDDKSTEFLLAITAERANVGYDRVVDALEETRSNA